MRYIKSHNISLLKLTDELRKEFYEDRSINLDNFGGYKEIFKYIFSCYR